MMKKLMWGVATMTLLSSGLAAEVWTSSLAAGGVTRDFRVFIPSTYDDTKPLPLVFVLHGGRGTAEGIEAHTRFSALAEKEGFLAVYPQGFNRQWNDGRRSPRASTADDVAFLAAVIDAVSAKYRVDPDRIYSTGISNGGFMSLRLACDLAGRLAAVASVAATMPAPLLETCRPAAKVSVLVMNGTEDPLVPYEGGTVRLGRIKRGEASSTEATITFWTSACSCAKYLSDGIDTDPADETRILREFYRGAGDPAVEVQLYKIEGGGHTWPDSSQYLPKSVVGRVSREIDATAVIWEFFKAHPRTK